MQPEFELIDFFGVGAIWQKVSWVAVLSPPPRTVDFDAARQTGAFISSHLIVTKPRARTSGTDATLPANGALVARLELWLGVRVQSHGTCATRRKIVALQPKGSRLTGGGPSGLSLALFGTLNAAARPHTRSLVSRMRGFELLWWADELTVAQTPT